MKHFFWTNWAEWTAIERVDDLTITAETYSRERSDYYKSIGWDMRVYYIS